MPWAPLLLQPSKAFAVSLPGDLDVPFDPGLIGLEKEMDMLFFDPGRTGYIRHKTKLLDNLKRDILFKRNGKWRLLSHGT